MGELLLGVGVFRPSTAQPHTTHRVDITTKYNNNFLSVYWLLVVNFLNIRQHGEETARKQQTKSATTYRGTGHQTEGSNTTTRAAAMKTKVGIVGFGKLGQFIADKILNDPVVSEKLELSWVWNRSAAVFDSDEGKSKLARCGCCRCGGVRPTSSSLR